MIVSSYNGVAIMQHYICVYMCIYVHPQLAVRDRVFIIDLNQLAVHHSQHDPRLKYVRFIVESIYSDPSLLKIGFAMNNSDDKMLEHVGRGYFQGISRNARSFLDLKVNNCDLKEFKGLNSLSDVSEKFLRKPINKSQRLSKWNNRPLSSEQLAYAALDAHCLLGILDAIFLHFGKNVHLNIAREMYNISDESSYISLTTSSISKESASAVGQT